AAVIAQAPCYVTADAASEQQVFRQFMTPTHAAAAPSASHRGGGHRVNPAPSAKAANLISDLGDGKTQAGALRRVGLPVYVPRLIPARARDRATPPCGRGHHA